jgi:outer membrane scaffolding protein for murein synthesis (MipA/OmpV family)
MGLMFGARELNAYFYEVDKRFAAVDRPVYHAKGGYLSAFISGLATYRLTSCITIMTSVRFDFHDQAVNSDSPLLDSAFTASFTTGFLWSAYQSRERELYQCDTRKTECFP